MTAVSDVSVTDDVLANKVVTMSSCSLTFVLVR